MRNVLLILAGAGLLALGLACTSSSSTAARSAPAPAGQDFTAFVKQQVVTHPDTTVPVDVSQTSFTDYSYDNPDAFDDVLGIPAAEARGHWSTVR